MNHKTPFPSGAKLLILWGFITLTLESPAAPSANLELPWREAGLTERQAAAHLLDRLSFGATPGGIDEVLLVGVEGWAEGQLRGRAPDPRLDRRLRSLDALDLSAIELAETFLDPGDLLRQAAAQGIVDRNTLLGLTENGEKGEPVSANERRKTIRRLKAWAQSEGYRTTKEMLQQLGAQKLLRAVYAENQLSEVLTNFWYNHFHVSTSNTRSRGFVLSYERDAIRPNILGSFRTLLGATARHPAMLLYLDNAKSIAAEGMPRTFDRGDSAQRGRGGAKARRQARLESNSKPRPRRPRPSGLNENYARELMELHTLGVDGGYRQQDVVEVARALSGWTVLSPGRTRDRAKELYRRTSERSRRGFVLDELFFFRADAHDAGEKIVLGRKLPANRGIEDGEDVLDHLATHPATARHLSQKIAVRFVSDEPPKALVDRLTDVFLDTEGDLERVFRSLLESPEFWSPQARRQKIKSPFELAVSALRALGAEVADPRGSLEWVIRMGQHLYAYPAPTGFPDSAEHWVNTGALLSRMNFGLQLAGGFVPGVWFDLEALNGEQEPESVSDALETYLSLLLPERDITDTLRQLEGTVADPDLARKVAAAMPSPGRGAETAREVDQEALLFYGTPMDEETKLLSQGERGSEGPSSPVAQVVGLILGSPEFQRR